MFLERDYTDIEYKELCSYVIAVDKNKAKSLLDNMIKKLKEENLEQIYKKAEKMGFDNVCRFLNVLELRLMM